jgi:hypothetical protein
MPILRLFAFVITLLSLNAALAQEPGYDPALGPGPEVGQDQGQVQPLPPPIPPPPNPTYDEQGYVPHSWRERQAPTAVRLPVSAAIPASFFAGRWGQVSFNNEGDLPKMAKVAHEYCNLPVTITLNSPNTFMMYVTTELKEVQVFEQSGSLYIIPTAQLSDGIIRGARELHVIDNNTFTLRYLEDEAHRRYGPNVFARCSASSVNAPPPAKGAGKTPGDANKPVRKKKKHAPSKSPEALKAQPSKTKQPE